MFDRHWCAETAGTHQKNVIFFVEVKLLNTRWQAVHCPWHMVKELQKHIKPQQNPGLFKE